MEKAIDAFLGSIPQLKPYRAIKGKAQAEERHHKGTLIRELLVDAEAVVIEGGGGLHIYFARHHDNDEPHVVCAIGLLASGRRWKLPIRQMLALPRECMCRHLADARARLTPYSTTPYAINGSDMVERRSAVTTTLEHLFFTHLKIGDTLRELQVDTEKSWVLICCDATALWDTLSTRIGFFVNRRA